MKVRAPQPAASGLDERFAPAASVADAVCYEGYVLYPYRASAAKNQFRWQWGVLAPPTMAARAAERSHLRAELVVEAHAGALLHVRVRGLQVQSRTVLAVVDGEAAPVERLDDGASIWTSFDEAFPWQADLAPIAVDDRAATTTSEAHVLGAGSSTEIIAGEDGTVRGRVARHRDEVTARVDVDLTPVGSLRAHDLSGQLVRVGITVSNDTEWTDPSAGREDVLRRSIASAHVLVAVDRGHLISSLDPPIHAERAVATCRADGLYPVLVGPGDDLVLASPIVLYDHPAIAPESAGDMFDATEIDEILALRVRTLTEEEKREARSTDARAAAVLDRCEAMGEAALGALHGTFRPVTTGSGAGSGDPPPFWQEDATFDPWSDTTRVGDTTVGSGTHVRLHPRRQADAQDLFVDGRTATVSGVFHDDAGQVSLAVALDDLEPDLQAWHGRYLYFSPEEVEPLEAAAAAPPGPKVLVAGVGNIFLGDDGFGVEVANRVDPASLPPGVTVADFGIRGVHLAYELLSGYDALVLVDAVSRGGAPGSLMVLEHDPEGGTEGGTLAAMDAHGMDPAAVLAMTADMGGHVGRVLVLGCEVAAVDEGIGLSGPVAAAVPAAVDALTELIADLAASAPPRPTPAHRPVPPTMPSSSEVPP